MNTSEAIRFGDVGALRKILNDIYYSTNFPTISDYQINVMKQTCVNLNKEYLLEAFKKYTI